MGESEGSRYLGYRHCHRKVVYRILGDYCPSWGSYCKIAHTSVPECVCGHEHMPVCSSSVKSAVWILNQAIWEDHSGIVHTTQC